MTQLRMDMIKRQQLINIFSILLSLIILLSGIICVRTSHTEEDSFTTYKSVVAEITDKQMDELNLGDYSVISWTIYFEAEITNGEKKGMTVSAVQFIDGMEAVNPSAVKPGSRVILFSSTDEDHSLPAFIFVEYDRSKVLIVLATLFILLLLVLGRRQGVRTLVSLVFTFSAIFLVFIPAILEGLNIYLATVLLCTYIILMSLLVINGANTKSFCAIVGNLGGLILAGLLALVFSEISHLTGMTGEDTLLLIRSGAASEVNLIALIWSGIVIGSLGAVMDVAMSVSTAMYELTQHTETRDYKVLLKSGLQVGADVLGTMTNTLLLAYVGSSLALLMIMITYYTDRLLLFNSEMVVVEVLQALIGSIGILAAIPITSLVAARIYSREQTFGGKSAKNYWQRKINDRNKN